MGNGNHEVIRIRTIGTSVEGAETRKKRTVISQTHEVSSSSEYRRYDKVKLKLPPLKNKQPDEKKQGEMS